MRSTRKSFIRQQICPRCLTLINIDQFTVSTPDGVIHEACESLPRPSKQQRKHSTLSARSAAALAKNKRRLS